jgi:hypothetical protein
MARLDVDWAQAAWAGSKANVGAPSCTVKSFFSCLVLGQIDFCRNFEFRNFGPFFTPPRISREGAG